MKFSIDSDPFVVEAFNRTSARQADDKNVFKRVARLSVYEMIRMTPMNIRQNRLKGCRVYFYNSEYFSRKEKGKRGMRLFAYKTGCNKMTYLTQIGFVDYTKNLNSSVWVSCQCDYYKYHLEYVNATLGASDHIYAWQQPPRITNPGNVPGACKHILAILDDAMKRTRQYAKLDKNKDLELEEMNIDETEDFGTDLKKKKPNPKNPDEQRSTDTSQEGLQEPEQSQQPFRPFTEPSGPESTEEG